MDITGITHNDSKSRLTKKIFRSEDSFKKGVALYIDTVKNIEIENKRKNGTSKEYKNVCTYLLFLKAQIEMLISLFGKRLSPNE